MKSVLIVSVEDSVPSLLAKIIKKSYPSVKVERVKNGNLAMKTLATTGGEYDLVIIATLILPDINGATLVESIREKYPDIAIILTTGYDEPKGHRAHGFLRKPFECADFLGKVVQVTGKPELSKKQPPHS